MKNVSTLAILLGPAMVTSQGKVCKPPINGEVLGQLGTCYANVELGKEEINQIIMSSLSIPECSNLSPFFNLEEWPIIQEQFPVKSSTKFLKFLTSMKDKAFQNICNSFSTNALPCAEKLVKTMVSAVKEESKGCCDPYLEEFQNKNGKSVQVWVNDMMVLVRDSVCAIQEPKDQTCGYTWLQVFGSTDVREFFKNILHGLQIPSDQACAAFEGRKFLLTTSKEHQLGNPTTGSIMSGCSRPLDALASKFAAVTDSNLFKSGTCQDVPKFNESILPEGLSPIVKQLSCLHIPNGFSATCEFSSEVDGMMSTEFSIESSNTMSLSIQAIFGLSTAIVTLLWL